MPADTGDAGSSAPVDAARSRPGTRTGDAMTPALRAAYISAVQKEAAAQHRVERMNGGFRATSSAPGLHAFFGARGVEVNAGGDGGWWRWQTGATRWGCEGDLAPVESTEPEVSENRTTYHRQGFDEWYLVGPLGIEQGFTLPAAPPCRARGGVEIVLAGGGDLDARVVSDGKSATLHDRSGAQVLCYTDLCVVDAAGKELAAELRTHEGVLAIWFDDRGATYPVTVDPLIVLEQQKVTASDAADGDYIGASVAVSGDTAVVSAYGRQRGRERRTCLFAPARRGPSSRSSPPPMR